jgi:hypothetical protein
MTRAGYAVCVSLCLASATGCVSRPRMCVASDECSSQFSCVAGRCQRTLGVAELQAGTRRVVMLPSTMAYVRRGDGASDGALPPLFTLGREGSEARLYLRFSVPLPPEVNILEAYVLMNRTTAVDSDSAPLTMHAARVVEAWDPRSIAWTFQPRYEDARSAGTSITASGRTLVRVDVREIVGRWRLHDARDQGIVIVADNATPLGVPFAISEASAMGVSSGESSPRLELYLKDKTGK